ncbi:MAG: hypothetical protein HY683_01485 [Chloroflexi bacterium]|nr:hypothetical protein [Chloroflexota bacterium]
MNNWKSPGSLVWITVQCPECHRIIRRVKLPGLEQRVHHRQCDNCATQGRRERQPQRKAGPERRRVPAKEPAAKEAS